VYATIVSTICVGERRLWMHMIDLNHIRVRWVDYLSIKCIFVLDNGLISIHA